jgi:hypothetical protein
MKVKVNYRVKVNSARSPAGGGARRAGVDALRLPVAERPVAELVEATNCPVRDTLLVEPSTTPASLSRQGQHVNTHISSLRDDNTGLSQFSTNIVSLTGHKPPFTHLSSRISLHASLFTLYQLNN